MKMYLFQCIIYCDANGYHSIRSSAQGPHKKMEAEESLELVSPTISG